MPALPDSPFTVRIKFTGTYGAAKWNVLQHVGHSSPGLTTADLNTFAGAVRGIWNTNFAPLMNTNVTMQSVECVDISNTSGAVGTNNTASIGSRSGTTALPASVALVLSWKIARRFKGGHPRTYLPGMLGADTVSLTQWTGAYLTLALAAGEAYRVGINGLSLAGSTGVYLACLSYYTGGALRPVPRIDAISACQVHTRVDSQRRRLGREII